MFPPAGLTISSLKSFLHTKRKYYTVKVEFRQQFTQNCIPLTRENFCVYKLHKLIDQFMKLKARGSAYHVAPWRMAFCRPDCTAHTKSTMSIHWTHN